MTNSDTIHSISRVIRHLQRALDAACPIYGDGPEEEKQALRELRQQACIARDDLEVLRNHLSRASDVQ